MIIKKYLVKFPNPIREKNISYINNAISEYVGSNIFKLLGFDVQNTVLETSFNKLEEKSKVNEIYYNGQIFDAYSKIHEIFKSAKKELTVIDAYADNTILDIIKRLILKLLL